MRPQEPPHRDDGGGEDHRADHPQPVTRLCVHGYLPPSVSVLAGSASLVWVFTGSGAKRFGERLLADVHLDLDLVGAVFLQAPPFPATRRRTPSTFECVQPGLHVGQGGLVAVKTIRRSVRPARGTVGCWNSANGEPDPAVKSVTVVPEGRLDWIDCR